MYFLYERFQWIEMKSVEGGKGVTVEELAKKFSIPKRSAATWLSRWANHYNKSRDIVQHMVKHVHGGEHEPGRYIIDNSCDWWGELFFESAKEDTYHDIHDTTGHKPLDIILGEETHTDSRYSKNKKGY